MLLVCDILLRISVRCKPLTGRMFVKVSADVILLGLTEPTSGGKRWHIWLRLCITCRKVAGSIPNGVIGVFRLLYPSARTMAM